MNKGTSDRTNFAVAGVPAELRTNIIFTASEGKGCARHKSNTPSVRAWC